MIHIGGRTYELVYDHKNGWNPEAFRNRYSDVLERYDYVIGDWGYNQLRLKGFFRDTHPKVTAGSSFASMSDYINEYCNFGCAYFVLQKQTGAKREGESEGDIYLDEIDMSERLTGTGDNAESAYRQAVPAAAAQTAAASEGGEAPAPVRREHARGPRGPRNDHRRDGHRSSYANRRDQDRDQDRGGEQGSASERGESGVRPERANEGRKPYNKDRDRSRGDREHNRQQGGHSSGGDRSGGGDRPRQKRQHFPSKAPVAAASEGQQPRSRDNAGGPKPSPNANANANSNANANKSDA